MAGNASHWGLSLLGAGAGGVLGYFAVAGFLLWQGDLSGLVLPGALIGIGAGLFARHESTARGALCGLAALAVGVFCAWQLSPFDDDPAKDFLLWHFAQLGPIPPFMVILGGLLAFFFGRGQFALRRARPSPPPPPEAPPTVEKAAPAEEVPSPKD